MTDLLIGIGTRLDVPTARWGGMPPGAKLARIDIDPAEMHRVRADVPIVADAADGAHALLAAVQPKADTERAALIAQAKKDGWDVLKTVQPQMSYLEVIRELLPEDGILCDEMTQVGYVSWFGFPFHSPRTLITSGFSGTLGAGFPTALGVKVGQPNRPVVAVTGDGGFLFGGSDLATAIRGPRIRLGAEQSGFPDLCQGVRCPFLAGHRCRRAARRADRGTGGKCADADRGDDRYHQGIFAVGVHFPGTGVNPITPPGAAPTAPARR
jgi:hypothetical protein